MVQVIPFSVSKLSNAFHASFMHAIVSLISEAGDSPLGLPDGFCAKYLEAIAKEQDIVNRTFGSPLTESLREQDALRDNYFRAVRNVFKNLRYVSDPSLKALYEVVNKKLIKPYPINIVEESDHKSSSHLRGFAFDVRQFLSAEQINKLGIKNDLEAMEEANEQFETLYLERVNEQTKNPAGLALECRAEVDLLFHQLVNTLNYYCNEDNNPEASIKSIALSARPVLDLVNLHITTVRRSIKSSNPGKGGTGTSGSGTGTSGTNTGTSKPTDKPTADKPIDKPINTGGTDSGYNGDL